jgi:uncharacterized protein YqeY
MSPTADAAPIRERLRRALPAAMKARDTTAVTALRTAIAAIDNAESVDTTLTPTSGPIAGAVTGLGAGEAARRQLSEDEMVALIQAEVGAREAAAADCDQAGQAEHGAQLRAEAAVLTGLLTED